jgi:hypothetical protein
MPADATPKQFLDVDWSRLPRPEDDGAARHLPGSRVPPVALPATDGSSVALGGLPGSQRGLRLPDDRPSRRCVA